MACWSSWNTFSCRSRSRVTSATLHSTARLRAGRSSGRTLTRYQPTADDAVERRRQADLLGGPAVVPRRLGEPVDRLGDLGRAGEQPLHGADLRRVRGARHAEIGLVGVEHAGVALGDEQALARRIGDQLGEVVARRLPGELQEADRVEEERDQPHHGQHGEEHQGVAPGLVLRQEGIGGRGADEQHGDEQHQQGAAGALRAVHRGEGRVRHDGLDGRAPRPDRPEPRPGTRPPRPRGTPGPAVHPARGAGDDRPRPDLTPLTID